MPAVYDNRDNPEEHRLKRVLSRLFPDSTVHPRIRLFVVFLSGQLPLALSLTAACYAESHIHHNDSLLTRSSPAAEISWHVFLAMCGLLASVVNAYVVDQLTSTPQQRRNRGWPRWSKKAPATGTPASSVLDLSRCTTQSVDAQEIELRVQQRGRLSVFNEHFDDDESLRDNTRGQANLSLERIENEAQWQADGFPMILSSDSEQEGEPPTYHEAVAVPLQNSNPVLIDIQTNLSRPRLVRRTAANPVETLRTSTGGPPGWSTKPGVFSALWRLCLSVLFITCILPLILSCTIPPLVRDKVYSHICDAYDWEVVLDAPASFNSPSMLPNAKFTERETMKTFRMEMSLDTTPPNDHYRRGTLIMPERPKKKKVKSNFDRFFHLKYAHRPLSAQLLRLVAYDTQTLSYTGFPVEDKLTGLEGDYTQEGHMSFPALGLKEMVESREDYYGFPRVVLERDGGEEVVVTSRVKRGSCAEMKVCASGVKATEAAVAVGPLLLGVVEAGGECRKGRRS